MTSRNHVCIGIHPPPPPAIGNSAHTAHPPQNRQNAFSLRLQNEARLQLHLIGWILFLGGMFARRTTFLLTIPTSAPDLPSHDCTPSLQSTLHNKAMSVNSPTPTVICIVLKKQHWSHKCGCQYSQYNSAPYTHHKLRRWSASGNTTHTLLPHPLPHLACHNRANSYSMRALYHPCTSS